jgi:hypothetical protein
MTGDFFDAIRRQTTASLLALIRLFHIIKAIVVAAMSW